MPHTPDPFDLALDAWLDHAARTNGWRSQATPDAYRRVWQPFARWCRAQTPTVHLAHLDAADLEAYVLSRTARARADEPVTVRYAWRVLSVVDQVLRHQARNAQEGLTGAGGRIAGPSAEPVRRTLERHPAWRWANAPENEALPEHLDAASAAQLLAHLGRARRASGDIFASQPRWQDVRDRAVVAVHLGSGLTPAEARALRPDDAVGTGGRIPGVPARLRVAACVTAPAREAPLAPWAGALLARWIEVRRAEAIGGACLFCSTRSGKPWSADGHALAVRRVLEAAGLDSQGVSGAAFRLRHTFALRQLRRGARDADVAAWLGVREDKVMARYHRVLDAPITDVV